MVKSNDAFNPEVTESSPRFVPLLPTLQTDMCPRSTTLYVGTHVLPTHLFGNAKVRLKSAINILAMTRLLDEKEEPGDALAYINSALLSLLSDALSEAEVGHPSLQYRFPARHPRPSRGFCGIAHHRAFRARTARLIVVPVLTKQPPVARSFRPFFRAISHILINQQVMKPRKKRFSGREKSAASVFRQMAIGFPGQPNTTQMTGKCSGNGFGCEQFTAIQTVDESLPSQAQLFGGLVPSETSYKAQPLPSYRRCQ